jgi:hypothetical protein
LLEPTVVVRRSSSRLENIKNKGGGGLSPDNKPLG